MGPFFVLLRLPCILPRRYRYILFQDDTLVSPWVHRLVRLLTLRVYNATLTVFWWVAGSKGHTPIPPDTYILVSAIKTPKSVADIVHQLSLSASPLSQVEDVLCCTLSLLEQHAGKIWSYWLNDLVGLVLEVYRYGKHCLKNSKTALI